MNMRVGVSVAAAFFGGGLLVGAQQIVKDVRPGEVPGFRPVTEEMLRNPPPEDWLNWRRTDNNWGYSTLSQITTQNVNQLQLQWAWSMDDTGANEATPLIHDGIMYLPNTRGVIQALDATNGELIWEYRPGQPTVAPRNPNAGEQSVIPHQSQRPPAAPADAGGDGGRGIQRNIAIFGDKIYGTTNDAEIVAIEAKTGKLVWKTTTADTKLG